MEPIYLKQLNEIRKKPQPKYKDFYEFYSIEIWGHSKEEIMNILSDENYPYNNKKLRDVIFESITYYNYSYIDIYECLAKYYIPEILDKLVSLNMHSVIRLISIYHGDKYNHKILDRGYVCSSIASMMVLTSDDESLLERLMNWNDSTGIIKSFIKRGEVDYLIKLANMNDKYVKYDRVELAKVKNLKVLTALLDDKDIRVRETAKNTLKENPELLNLHILYNSIYLCLEN